MALLSMILTVAHDMGPLGTQFEGDRTPLGTKASPAAVGDLGASPLLRSASDVVFEALLKCYSKDPCTFMDPI